MFKRTQFCLWIAVLPCSALFAEENLSHDSPTPSVITTQHADSLGLPVKVTARDHVVLDKMADNLPNVNSTSESVFSQAMQLIDSSREMDEKTWVKQFAPISDARVGRIVDLYLQLYDAEGVEHAKSLEDLLHLKAGLTAAQGYEKARVISFEREVFFKLFQKGLTLPTEEDITPLAALSLVWWLHQNSQPTLAELSASIYRAEHKEIRIHAAILYNCSHYGHRAGDIAGISTEDLANWGIGQLNKPEQPVARAVRALRVIHEGINAIPALSHLDGPYLPNGFAPKNAQGSYLTNQLPEMILTGCNLVGFDACSQQDFTQFLDLQHPVGSLVFLLKTTLKLHYQLQGKDVDELNGFNAEQLYDLLFTEEINLQQAGGVRYSPTVIFLSHFSQSNEAEPLTVGQMAHAFKRIAGEIDASDFPDSAQSTFIRLQQLAGYIVDGTASDVEQTRFVSDLNDLAPFFALNPPLYALALRGSYKTEQQKIERQLDYLDMRLAYRHPPAAFDEDQAIIEILREKGVRDIHFPRQYTYRQDLQHGFPQKEFDSPVDEFKRRRNASNHFVANMSMPGNNGRPINVFDTLDAKKAQYYAHIKAHPALRAQAIEALINSGERPEGSRLQHKINALAEDYQPESENTRFWGNAWTALENHWICKLPLPNPMCTIARVEGPRYRNDKEGMAAGMTAMVMEAGQLRGMERGVKVMDNPTQGIKSFEASEPAPSITEVNRQMIQSPRGTEIEVQQVRLKDPSVSGGARQAWVRQGGSGAYWEVDLATGQDLGVVLKQGPEFIKQGKLLGGGAGQSKGSSLEFNPEIKLGKRIGRGMFGDVYLDVNNPGFVLKKLFTRDKVLITEVHTKEVEFFNRYYGEGSAEIINEGNQYYIRMYRVPGKTLTEINTKIFPPSAKGRFLSMMDDLGYYNITHDDLNFNNVLYDVKTNTFYPIDFDNAYDAYYSPREESIVNQSWGRKMRFDDIIEHIETHTKN
ncbi:serine/threonine-protein kinase [Yersinia kristensenii]|uniref:OspG family effector kinase n=1 Tax=Yersinia kristensenii TaxID=28152 RepID=UPI001643E8F8|nr:serine/threonine-protein kinase [Yersinia kristensenii]